MSEMKVGCVTVIEYPAASDKYVLVEETKPHKRGLLNLPGGGVDTKQKGKITSWESILKCPVRESAEETHLKVALTGFMGLFEYKKEGLILLAFAATAVGGQLKASAEHPTVDAYSYDDIKLLEAAERLRNVRVVNLIEQYRSDAPLVPLEYMHVLAENVLPQPHTSPEAVVA